MEIKGGRNSGNGGMGVIRETLAEHCVFSARPVLKVPFNAIVEGFTRCMITAYS